MKNQGASSGDRVIQVIKQQYSGEEMHMIQQGYKQSPQLLYHKIQSFNSYNADRR
jgi:hypothetical protein